LAALVDLKIRLVKLYGWSLLDIDQTDIQSLLPFVSRQLKTSSNGRGAHASITPKGPKIFCDAPGASWL